MSKPYRFCPHCGQPLGTLFHGGLERSACNDATCGFIHWDNPVPVVAAIVEHEGRVILARNVGWPAGAYALITGFLERGETPHTGVQREVEEELGLTPLAAHYVGLYPFRRQNQLIIAYHVPAVGTVRLNEELADFKHVPFEELRYWPAATGYALRDWLKAAHGIDAPPADWPPR